MLVKNETNKERRCGVCNSNGAVKKYYIYFNYNRKARVCLPCIQSFASSGDVALWLSAHAIFGKTGKLEGFKRVVK